MHPSPLATLQASTAEFELLFHSAPISLWLEDYSALKALFETWRAQGVSDLAAHLRAAPQRVTECAQCLKVLQVNQQTLRVFAAQDQQDLVSRLGEVFRDDTFEQMLAELLELWSADRDFSAFPQLKVRNPLVKK